MKSNAARVVSTAALLVSSTVMGLPARAADPQISASVQINTVTDFDAPLTPLGAWLVVGSHGRCWHPRGIAADWRPYCDGQWIWTDCGWYWQSDEPWAWAGYPAA